MSYFRFLPPVTLTLWTNSSVTTLYQVVGYVDVDDLDGFGPEIYRLYNGLSVDEQNVVGEYRAMIWGDSGVSTTWTLTARVAGEVVWVETGVLPDGDELTTELFSLTIDDYVSYEGC